MRIDTWPTDRAMQPVSAVFNLLTPSLDSTSPITGDAKEVELLGARWVYSPTFPAQNPADRAKLEAWLNRLAGRVGRLRMWHPGRVLPKGTLRGSPLTVGTTAQHARQVTLAATNGKTLLMGDMIGVGGQLNQVSDDCVASGGQIIVPLVVPMRAQVAGGTAVVLDRPTALFALPNTGVPVPYAPGICPPFAVDLIERFA